MPRTVFNDQGSLASTSRSPSPSAASKRPLMNGNPHPSKKAKVANFMSSADSNTRPSGSGLRQNGAEPTAKGKMSQKNAERKALLLEKRKQLPVWHGAFSRSLSFCRGNWLSDCAKKGRDAILRKIEENDTVVVLGETGSGKSTRTSPVSPLNYTAV
jgi:type IV secretory pathway ATPase VirB11/archaellum biosynthesis ATPase